MRDDGKMCVLFGGSAIGAARHHGIIPFTLNGKFEEKDVDIACYFPKVDSKTYPMLRNASIRACPKCKIWVVLQGLQLHLSSGHMFIDIWLHGTGSDFSSERNPSRCVGWSKGLFGAFQKSEFLPELRPWIFHSKTNSLKKNIIYPSCYMFYRIFGRSYQQNNRGLEKDLQVSKGLSPIWKFSDFWPPSFRNFGGFAAPVPRLFEKYLKRRYGKIRAGCGDGGSKSCFEQKRGYVFVERRGNRSSLGEAVESLIIGGNILLHEVEVFKDTTFGTDITNIRCLEAPKEIKYTHES